MSKLTLSIDERVVKRAKRYAKQHGLSVSTLVETYLDSISRPKPAAPSRTPVLDELQSLLHGAHEEDYEEYLVNKYLK